MTSTTLCLRMAFMQKKVLQLYGRAQTIEQVNDVFKLASELITLTEELNPISTALYELVLERRTELLNQPQLQPSEDSWYLLRVPSLQCRAGAALAYVPYSGARSSKVSAPKVRAAVQQ